MRKVLLVANSGWGLANFRLPLAHALVDAGMEVAFVSPYDEHVERIIQADFRWIEWRLDRRGISPLKEANAYRRLLQIYRDENPDVVQHYTIKTIIHGSLAAGRAGIGLVLNSFTGVGFPYLDNGLSRVARPFLSPLIKNLLSRPDTVTIFHNVEDREFLVGLGVCPQDQAAVILGSGVDTSHFVPTESTAKSVSEGSSPVVLMAARMLKDKGVGEFVEAARMLTREGVSARFVLAGAPDPGSRLSVSIEKLESWKREGVVEFLGRVDGIRDLLQGTDLAVLPSYHEGLPRFLVEAAATGLPLVATDVVGCRTVVKDGVNGVLVPPRDSRALANAIRTLVAEPALRTKLGTSGRKMAIDLFGHDKIIPQYVELFKAGLSGLASDIEPTTPPTPRRSGV
jgi:glycosyltransferase involved in cell wall biosynthesis